MTTQPFEIDLLQHILMEVQEDASFTEYLLRDIYLHLFLDKSMNLEQLSDRLLAGVLFLKNLVAKDELKSPEAVWAYLVGQKASAVQQLEKRMNEIDRERIRAEFEKFVSICTPQTLYPYKLFRNFCFHDDVVPFFKERFVRYWHRGSYKQSCDTYFRQFVENAKDEHIYILKCLSNYQIEKRTVSDVISRLDFFGDRPESASSRNETNPSVFISFNYEKLLENLTAGKIESQFSSKVGLASWMLFTRMDSIDQFTDDVGCLSEKLNQLHFDHFDSFSNDVFEHWVYLITYELILDKTWSILKTPHHYSWITSDKPGFVVDKEKSQEKPAVYRNVFKHTKGASSIFYPLSKDYCLRIDTPNDKLTESKNWSVEFQIATEYEVNEVNEITVKMGEEMAISSDRKMLEVIKLP